MIGSILQIICVVGIYLAEKKVRRQMLNFNQIQANLLDNDASSLYCYDFELKTDGKLIGDSKSHCLPIRLDHQAPRRGRWPRAICVVARRTLETFPNHPGLEREAKRCL